MRRHLNTLYISTQGTYLSKDGECVSVRIDGKERAKVPIHTLEGLVCFGRVSASPFLLGHCAKKDVAVSFLTEQGKFLASVRGPASGNVLLRRAQYRLADDPAGSAEIARAFVIGKLSNCRTVLLRTLRDKGGQALEAAVSHLSGCLARLEPGTPLDSVRGVEGEAAGAYFGVFNDLVSSDDPAFAFSGRNRRPPRDPTNCLLSFLYVLLMHDVRGALEACGLDPAVGFLHRDRPGRPSLALDVMEEFRPYLGDRLALTLINRGQVRPKGFERTESGGVLMDDATRKEVLVAYQKRKQEEVMHPFLGKRMTVGMLWHMQARLLARHVRGDLDAYPPFSMR